MSPQGTQNTSVHTEYWTAYLRIGFAVVVAISLALLMYLRVTPAGGHRGLLTVIDLCAGAVALGVFVGVPRVASRPWRAEFSLASALVTGALLTVICMLDGGIDSPFAFLLILPVLNASAALPRWAVSWCGVATFADLVVLGTTDMNVTSEAGHLIALAAGVCAAIGLAVSITFVRARLEAAEQVHRSALLEAAETDALTGCLNQRAFYRLLAAELDGFRYSRSHTPFSVAIVDIDLLKAYNDGFGHEAGDQALVDVGRSLRTHCRPSDTVARIGGDEFAVILPAAGLSEAVEVARRLAAVVNDGSGPTVSIGVAEVAAQEPTAKRVFRDADTVLYEAKASGRAAVASKLLGSPHRINQDRPSGIAAADRKLLEWRADQSEREKAEVMSQLEALLRRSPLGVSFVDGDFRVQMANAAVTRIVGVAAQELLGKTLEEALPDLWARIGERYGAVRHTGQDQTFELETPSEDEPGLSRYWLSTLFPVVTHGEVTGVGGLAMDITDGKRLELANEHLVATVAAALATAVESHDPYTSGHEARVADISGAICDELGLGEAERRDIVLAATVHDVGKIRVPAELLARPGRLTAGEMTLVREHSRIGYEILMSVELPERLCRMVLQHHERLDGSGYPDGLRADEICQGAKIMAVADVVDAMSSSRPYRDGLGIDRALAEVESGAGTRYDAAAVAACARLFWQGRLQTPTPHSAHRSAGTARS